MVFAENAKLDAVKMIEIKLSQGAKPGHGGILPAGKLTPEMKEKYFRFLGQHRIPVDHIYRRRPFTIEDLRLARKHGMQSFCIANVLKIPGVGRPHRRKDGTQYVSQGQVDAAIGYLEPLIEKYGEAGLLEALLILPLPGVFELGDVLGFVVGGVEVVDAGLEAGVHQGEVLIRQGDINQ